MPLGYLILFSLLLSTRIKGFRTEVECLLKPRAETRRMPMYTRELVTIFQLI